MKIFTTKPIATLISVMTVLYGLDAALIGAGVLHGAVAAWATAAATALNLILGWLAHGKVTPLARPRDRFGCRLVPERTP